MHDFHDRILTVLFLVILFLPVSMAALPHEATQDGLEEKRRLTEKPHFPDGLDETKAFPRHFESYFNDHFRMRGLLIRAHNRLKIKLLKQSPQKDVLMGREGWLFYARNNLLEDFFGLEPFSKKDLITRQRLLEAKRDWLKSHGIPYVFVVAPNKQSIYPERMPEGYDHFQKSSRLDQFLRHMQSHSDVVIVDLRHDLVAGKSNGPLYFSTDTHWNEKGTFIAYRRIMNVLHDMYKDPQLAPRAHEDYRSVAASRGGGDLAKMLGIQDEIEENYDRLEPEFTPCGKEERLYTYLNHDWTPFPEPVAYNCPNARLRLVMLHDSFGKWLRPYVVEHFRRSVFIWQHALPGKIFKAVMLKEKPDIVVEEIVERMIYYMKSGPEYLPG